MLALLLPAAALGADWTGFASVPTSGAQATGLKLASDSAGNQVAVWVEQPSPFKVRASFRPAGGAWSPAQTLDATATTLPLTDLAVDAAGNFILLYSEVTATGTTTQMYSAYLPAGQTSFGAPQTFGALVSGGPTLRGVAVAFGTDGTAQGVAAYSTSIVAARRPAGAGSAWTLNSTGLPAGSGGNIDVAVTSDGTPTLADYPTAGGQPRHTRFNGTAWAAITTPAGATGNATGVVRIVPSANNGTTTIYNVFSTATGLATQSCPVGTAGATQCTARATLNTSSVISAFSPSLAVDPATGNGVVIWIENTGVVTSRRSGAAGAWPVGAQLSVGASPAVAFDSLGTAMAVFGDGNNHLQFLQAAGGAAFTPPALALTDPAQAWTAPALAADNAGDVMGAWLSSSATAIQSAVYDAVAPAISSMNIPVGVAAGADRGFDATASDTWSGVSYTWDFGDGATATGQSVTHAYGAPGSYTARMTATDGAGNASSQTQTVDVTPAPVTGLARPVAGKTVNVEPVSGVVLVRIPGSSKFVPLTAPAQIREGSVIDARKGRVRITIDNGRGGLDTADFYGGIFKFTQAKVKAGQLWFANLYLYAGSFKGCPRAPRNPKIATLSGKRAKKQNQSRSVRHLWGSGEGAFRTVGRYSSATVRGTTWLTDDKCNGTLTKVTAGKVGVRDFVLKKTVLVKKGKSYLALAKPAKKATKKSRG